MEHPWEISLKSKNPISLTKYGYDWEWEMKVINMDIKEGILIEFHW